MPAAGRRAGSTLVTAATVLVAGAAAAASGANKGRLAICTTAPNANALSSLRCHPLNCGLGTLTAYPYYSVRQSSRRLNSITPLVQGLGGIRSLVSGSLDQLKRVRRSMTLAPSSPISFNYRQLPITWPGGSSDSS